MCIGLWQIGMLGLFLLGLAVMALFRGMNPQGDYADHQVDTVTVLMLPVGLLLTGVVTLSTAFYGGASPIATLFGALRAISPVAQAVLLIPFFVLLWVRYNGYWPKRLAQWAAYYNWTLIEHKRSYWWQSGKGFIRSKYQHTFNLKLATGQNDTKSALVTFGDFWGFSPGDVSLEWQDNE
jgi:hypothetical protein